MWAKASISPCSPSSGGHGGSAAVPRSGSSTYPQGAGRRSGLGGPDLRMIVGRRRQELAVGAIASQQARPVEDGQRVVGVVMDAHPDLDEVGPQRALRQ